MGVMPPSQSAILRLRATPIDRACINKLFHCIPARAYGRVTLSQPSPIMGEGFRVSALMRRMCGGAHGAYPTSSLMLTIAVITAAMISATITPIRIVMPGTSSASRRSSARSTSWS